MALTHTEIDSPVGRLLAIRDERGLRGLWFDGPRCPSLPAGSREDTAAFLDLTGQLGEYFAGERRRFDLEVAPEGSEFQTRVWDRLREIPYGETVAYGELATELGDPGAARAVGLANGANPVSIVIPCHRVIGADGSLTGYGGGLERKRFLLRLEGVDLPATAQRRLL